MLSGYGMSTARRSISTIAMLCQYPRHGIGAACALPCRRCDTMNKVSVTAGLTHEAWSVARKACWSGTCALAPRTRSAVSPWGDGSCTRACYLRDGQAVGFQSIASNLVPSSKTFGHWSRTGQVYRSNSTTLPQAPAPTRMRNNPFMTLALPDLPEILRAIAARADSEHIAALSPAEIDFAMSLAGRSLLESVCLGSTEFRLSRVARDLLAQSRTVEG